ncbi:MAG: hypothetical protein WKF88_05645 [Ferruginibacter sp.]
MTVSRVHIMLHKDRVKRASPKKEEPISVPEPETFELELDGEIVNRQTRGKYRAADTIRFFLEQYGTRGKAYYIRQSKMNFTSLIKQHDGPDYDTAGSEEGDGPVDG